VKKHGVENFVVTGKTERRRERGHQRLKYVDSLCASWKDNESPTQLIRASEDRALWHHVATNVVSNGMTPLQTENG